jgi:hypothetical protein
MKAIATGMAAAALALASGCASQSALIEERKAGGGVTREYAVPPEAAWTIARSVLRWEGAEAIEERREEGCLLTSFGMTLFSYGSLAGVWIEPAAPDGSKVTVLCKRRLATNLATVMTEGQFHRLFARGVEIVRSGRPLPESAPE